jgi:hypothetical protein
MQSDQAHTVGRLWEITHNAAGGDFTAKEEMGDFLIDFDQSDFIPGNTESFQFNITLSGNSQASKPIYFTLTNDNVSEGLEVSVTEIGAFVVVDNNELENSTTFTAGSTKTFLFEISLDEYSPAGPYTCNLILEKN